MAKIIEKIIQWWAFEVRKRNIVVALFQGGMPRKLIYGKNIVTDDGDEYYAQMSAGETPTNSYVGLRLGTSLTSPTKSDTDVGTEDSNGRKATDATYPKTNDSDTDNDGSGTDVVTWRFSYSKSEGVIDNISEGAIVDDTTTPTSALCHFLFDSVFDKKDTDTMKVFVNHTFNGV